MNVLGLALIALVMLCVDTVQAGELILTLNIPHKDTRTAIILTRSQAAENRPVSSSASPCAGGIATVLYTHASHPGGSRNGWPNEDNWGRGNRCYLDREQSWYVLIGGLENSQYGDTFVFGPGTKYRLLETLGVSVDVGVEIPFVSYELYSGKVVRGLLPLAYASISYRINKATKIGLMQMWLPKGGVTLRGNVIDTTSLSSPHAAMLADPSRPPLSSWDGSQTRPSLVLHYQF